MRGIPPPAKNLLVPHPPAARKILSTVDSPHQTFIPPTKVNRPPLNKIFQVLTQ